jgi:hypothetical protein
MSLATGSGYSLWPGMPYKPEINTFSATHAVERFRGDDDHGCLARTVLEVAVNLLVIETADNPSAGTDLALIRHIVVPRDQEIKEGLVGAGRAILPRALDQQPRVVQRRTLLRKDFSDNRAAGIVVVTINVDKVAEPRTFVERVLAHMKNPCWPTEAEPTNKARGWREREDVSCCDFSCGEYHHLSRCVTRDGDPGHVCLTIPNQIVADREAFGDILKVVQRESKSSQPKK